MRTILFVSALLGGLFMLGGPPAQATPSAGLHAVSGRSGVTQVDYYWNRRHWRHRRWSHHHWHYWN
jgi:hypothetical protein